MNEGENKVNPQERVGTTVREVLHKFYHSGWRPLSGWTVVLGFGYAFVVYPVLIWMWAYGVAKGAIPATVLPPSAMDGTLLMTLLGLGTSIGIMRSVDKQNSTNSDK